jgi:Flp pilus assembly protein TadB
MTDDEEKSDRQLIELLNELRVALPGVQILFAFLLAVPFQMRFSKVTPTQRDLYFATLLATALSTIFLIAPSATHRVRFHKRDREYLIETGNKYLLTGLGFLAIAVVLALVLISDVLYNGVVVWLAPAAVGALLVFVWFIRPLLRREHSGP